jgi:hypothetical protein
LKEGRWIPDAGEIIIAGYRVGVAGLAAISEVKPQQEKLNEKT